MAPFAGWEMPVQFRGIAAEHEAVRTTVGAFDVSHMGQIRVAGPAAASLLEYLLPAEPSVLERGRMLYTLLCNQEGGIIDDLTVYRLETDEYLLVVNASRTERDHLWIREACRRFSGVETTQIGSQRAIVAVQGPDAEAVLSGVLDADVGRLSYYAFLQNAGPHGQLLVSRNGYTGEDGFEIICAGKAATTLWEALLDADAEPCGLGCRDTLRTEMGFCLYGNEIDEATNPMQARLGWTLRLDKTTDFVGKKALIEQRDNRDWRRLVGLELLEQGIPRRGQIVFDAVGEVVGEVSSGTYSPTLKRGIALCYVERGNGKKGTALQIEIRGKRKRVQVASLPFVPARVKSG